MTPKNTICIWYDKDAEEAARFYAATFPDSKVGAIHRSPMDNPGNKAGDVMVVEFTVLGIPCIGLNGGPIFPHTEAFSFLVATDDQEETDRYWNAIIGNGGRESECGWLNRPGFPRGLFVQNSGGFFKSIHLCMEFVLQFLRRPMAIGAV